MKTFIALCLVLVAVAAQEPTLTAAQVQKLKEHYKVCTASSGVDVELVKSARQGQFSDDPKLAEFFDCMFKRVGFLNDQRQLQVDVIKSKVPSTVASSDLDKLLKACARVTSVAPEKVALETYKCYLTESPVKIHLIPASQ